MKGITCCLGKPFSDAILSQILIFLVIFPINQRNLCSKQVLIFSLKVSESIFFVVVILFNKSILYIICDAIGITLVIPFLKSMVAAMYFPLC